MTLLDNYPSTEPTFRTPDDYVPRILSVDDDPDFQTIISVHLEKYNVQLEKAYFGMQGIAEAIQSIPDLILMDLAMPNGNGEYFLECIKANCATAHIPVLVLTGMRNPELKRRIMSGGAELVIAKPIEFDDLMHHVSRYIDIQKRDVVGVANG